MAKIGKSTRTVDPQYIVANNVRLLRVRNGWSQAETAKRAGLASVSMIETGERMPRMSTLEKLAKIFRVSVFDLQNPNLHDSTTHSESRGGIVNQALIDFLASEGVEGITGDEIKCLVRVRTSGQSLTPEIYGRILAAYRAKAH